MSGIEGKDVLLLLEDYQMIDEEFLELVDSLLSSGDVPGLYTSQELEPLLSPLKDLAAEEGFRGSASSFFAQRKFGIELVVLLQIHTLLLKDFCN